MKYKDMDQNQKEAYQSILLHIINVKTQEEQEYGRQFLRLLTLGNGSGIVILSAFMGSIADKSEFIAYFTAPLMKFSIGLVLSAITYIPLLAVSNQATIHFTNQVDKFFRNTLDIESFQSYGFSNMGRNLVILLQLGSLAFFMWGLFESIQILKTIK